VRVCRARQPLNKARLPDVTDRVRRVVLRHKARSGSLPHKCPPAPFRARARKQPEDEDEVRILAFRVVRQYVPTTTPPLAGEKVPFLHRFRWDRRRPRRGPITQRNRLQHGAQQRFRRPHDGLVRQTAKEHARSIDGRYADRDNLSLGRCLGYTYLQVTPLAAESSTRCRVRVIFFSPGWSSPWIVAMGMATCATAATRAQGGAPRMNTRVGPA
jgi:hypothetical protein